MDDSNSRFARYSGKLNQNDWTRGNAAVSAVRLVEFISFAIDANQIQPVPRIAQATTSDFLLAQ